MRRVLVIDDDPLICDGLARILSEKYSVGTAKNGEEALGKVGEENFDVILTDLVMPGISGMDVLKKVKDSRAETKIIMITAYATVDSAVEAMRSGATDYIRKPFQIDEVLGAVTRALREADFEKNAMTRSSKLKIDSSKIDIKRDQLLKSVANPIRRGVIELLDNGSLSFTSIKNELNIDDPTKLSFHLRTLKSSKLIQQDEEKIYFLSTSGKEVVKILKHLATL